MYTYTYICICLYLHIYTYLYMCVCARVIVYMCVCECVWCVCMCMFVCVCRGNAPPHASSFPPLKAYTCWVCVLVCVCVCMRTRVCVRVCEWVCLMQVCELVHMLLSRQHTTTTCLAVSTFNSIHISGILHTNLRVTYVSRACQMCDVCVIWCRVCVRCIIDTQLCVKYYRRTICTIWHGMCAYVCLLYMSDVFVCNTEWCIYHTYNTSLCICNKYVCLLYMSGMSSLVYVLYTHNSVWDVL